MSNHLNSLVGKHLVASEPVREEDVWTLELSEEASPDPWMVVVTTGSVEASLIVSIIKKGTRFEVLPPNEDGDPANGIRVLRKDRDREEDVWTLVLQRPQLTMELVGARLVAKPPLK